MTHTDSEVLRKLVAERKEFIALLRYIKDALQSSQEPWIREVYNLLKYKLEMEQQVENK